MRPIHPLVTELERIRRARGLSQNRLAAMSGVNRKTLASWSNGQRTPSIDALTPVLAALGRQITTTDTHQTQRTP